MYKTKKAPRLLAALLIMALCLTPLFALANEFATVQGGGLNLRETASTDAKILAQYPTGTWIEVTEKDATWCKVSVQGKSGYMMTKFLNFGTTGSTMYVRTNTGIGLNLRSAPSAGGSILGSYPINTAVTVLQKGTEWHKVQVGGQTGYMASAYLKGASSVIVITKPCDPYTAKTININGGSYVNFRAYPSLSGKILSQIPVGSELTVTEKGIDWAKVEFNGQAGYVSLHFLVKK